MWLMKTTNTYIPIFLYLTEVNLFILAINYQNIIYFMKNYISKPALFFGQINYLFSLFELLFSCMETLELCFLSAMNFVNSRPLNVYLGDFQLVCIFSEIFFCSFFIVKMNLLSFGNLHCIFLSVFQFKILYH